MKQTSTPAIFSFFKILLLIVISTISAQGQYQLNGDAVNLSGDCFRLTRERDNELGSVFYRNQINLLQSFTLEATLNFGDRNGSGADGMAFIFAKDPNLLGSTGEGMGFGGISPSLIVELDDYQNNSNSDPGSDHIAIMKNGDPDHGSNNNLAGPEQLQNIEDGNDHCFRIEWDAQNLILIAALDNREVIYFGNIIIEIFSGNPQVYFGFTASTGGSNNRQTVCINTSSATFSEMEDLTVCLGDSARLEPAPNGMTYTWIPDPTLSNSTIENPNAVPLDTTNYMVLIEYPCGTKFFDTVTVNVIPSDIRLEPAGPFCASDLPVRLTHSPPGGDFLGLATATGVFDPRSVPPGDHEIIYSISDGNCVFKSSTIIRVNPLPVIAIDPLPNICENDSIFQLNYAPFGGTWTGIADNSGIIRPLDLGANTFATTYIFTDTLGCTDSTILQIPILPKPPTTIAPILPLCINGDSITLAASPIGGTWTGVGSTAVFDPQDSGIGAFEVTYQFSDSFGCQAIDTAEIQVNDLPVIALQAVNPFCENDTLFSLSANPSGGIWSGDSDASGVINPRQLLAGSFEAFYEYTDMNGCTNFDSIDIVVNPIPLPVIDPAGPFCESEMPMQLTANLNGGAWSGTDPSGVFNPQIAMIGLNAVTYEFTNNFRCKNSTQIDIEVLKNPEIMLTSGVDFCESDPVAFLTAEPANGAWSGITDAAGGIMPQMLGNGTFSARYEFTDALGCSDTTDFQITIAPGTPIDFSNIGPFCQNADNQLVTANPSGGTFSQSADVLGEISPQNLSIGQQDVRYEFTDSRGCKTDTSFQIEILNIPNVEINALDTVCAIGVLGQFSASPSNGNWGGILDPFGQFDPQILGPGTYDVIYEFTDGNGCQNRDDTTLIIRDFISISFDRTGPFCLEDDDLFLEAMPFGGTWSGDVDSDGRFNPSDLGNGNFQAEYEYKDFAGCITREVQNFEVLAPVQITFGDSQFCENDDVTTLTANPPGGTWSGTNVTPDGEINPADFAPGTYILTYNYTQPSAGCNFSEIFGLTIFEKPDVDFIGDTVLCQTLDPQSFMGVPDRGIWSGPIDNDGVVNPRDLAVDNYQIRYTVFNQEGCRNTIEKSLEITAPPSVTGFESDTICLNGGMPGNLRFFATGTAPFDLAIFNGTSTDTLRGLDSGDEISFTPTETTTYQITSISDTRCADDLRRVASITVFETPEAAVRTGLEVCNSTLSGETTFLTFDSLIVSGDASGRWGDLDNSGAIGSFPTLDFKGVTPGQYRFQYTTGAAESPCSNVVYETILTVRDCRCPSVTTLPAGSLCSDNALVDLSDLKITRESGVWEITDAPLGSTATIFNDDFEADGSSAGDYELTFTIDKAPLLDCPDSSVQIITLFDPPTADVISTFEICNSDDSNEPTVVDFSTMLLSGDMTGMWTDLNNSGATGSFPNLDFQGTTAGQYRFQYETNSAIAPCNDFQGELLLTINDCRCQANMIEPIEPFCSDNVTLDLADITQTTEPGTWSLTGSPAGSIAGLNGTIFDATGSPSGDYELTFTLTNPTRPGCPQSSNHTLKISEFVQAGSFASDLEICNDGSDLDLNDLLTGETLGGVWKDLSSVSAGASFDNGILSGQNLANGVYEFEYLITTDSPCKNDSARISITIENAVNAGEKITDFKSCSGKDSLIQLFDFIENNDLGGAWSDISLGPVSNFDPAGNLNLADFPPGFFFFQYKIPTLGICEADSVSVIFEINETPIADAGNSFDLSCTEPSITLGQGSSEGMNIKYLWSPNVNFPGEKTNVVTRAGTYFLTVTDALSGCFSIDTAIIGRGADLPFLEADYSSVTCFGDNDGLIDVSNVLGGSPPFLFSLNGAPFSSESTFENLGPGSYILDLEDSEGCSDKLIFKLTEPDELSVELLGDFPEAQGVVEQGDELLLTAQTVGSFDSIQWLPDSIFQACDIFTDSIICLTQNVEPQSIMTYSVQVFNENGCSDFAELSVRVKKVRRVFVPAAFSPNGDDNNDFLEIFGDKNVVNIKSFSVFDRWGGKVFENRDFAPNDPTAGWDGKYNGQAPDPGVFVWFAEIEFRDGTMEVFKGDVTLMR